MTMMIVWLIIIINESWEKRSQVPHPTCYWKWVGGTNPSRADNFSSEAPSLKMWLVPPHMSHIFGFSGMQGRMLAWQNLRKSIQKRARADLVPPPVCQFTRLQFVSSRYCYFQLGFLTGFVFVFARHITGTAQCCHLSPSNMLYGGCHL